MENQELSNNQNLPEEGALNVQETNASTEITSEKTEKTESPVSEKEAIAPDEVHHDDDIDQASHEDDHHNFGHHQQVPHEDYSIFERPELISKLNDLINNNPIESIVFAIEELKTAFYKKYRLDYQVARDNYLAQEGNPEDFKFADEMQEETFKELYSRFRVKKAEHNQKLEIVKEDNLKKKYQIIEEIKVLINKEESINKTFQEFRDLQQRWREVGLVPQSELKNLWETYNHNVEQFYDYIKINKELRDLDLKKNLESKIELCEKAEALVLEESVIKAFRTLQDYHNQWREIGPVPNEQKDDIWERFKAATTLINKKHQEYFEGQKEQQVKNLEQKIALCERVEEIIAVEIAKPKEWEEKAAELVKIQEMWRTIGYAPKKDNNKVYQRFKSACDQFFAKKRDFYKDTKEEQKNNLQRKLDLCVQAEAVKDSTEWKKTTEDFINLQKRWKEIGQVPKKQSEPLWKRFRTACDHFFNAKSAHFSQLDSSQEENLKLKLDLIEKVKNFEKSDTDKENLQRLMDIQKQWSDIGHVPISKKDQVQKAFREAINLQFEQLKLETSERNKVNYKNKVESWSNNQSRGKLYSERNKLISRIKELENEISLYENNIGFFSKSTNSDSMVKDVNRKIEQARERMVELKEKLKMLDQADNEA
jgi:hypothetical protein